MVRPTKKPATKTGKKLLVFFRNESSSSSSATTLNTSSASRSSLTTSGCWDGSATAPGVLGRSKLRIRWGQFLHQSRFPRVTSFTKAGATDSKLQSRINESRTNGCTRISSMTNSWAFCLLCIIFFVLSHEGLSDYEGFVLWSTYCVLCIVVHPFFPHVLSG